MLSRFLWRTSKLSPRQMQMQRFRLFSSSPSLAKEECPPYFILGSNTPSPYSEDKPGEIGFYTVSDWDVLDIERKVPFELLEARGSIGASKGWIVTQQKSCLCLQDDMKVNASESDPKRISLPRLRPLPHSQTQIVTSVAMSPTSPEVFECDDDDCVLAVKFLGPQLSLCRPASGIEWTNIRITDPSFFTSRVMFSQRDQMFCLPAAGGGYVGSWGLEGKHKLQKLRFRNLPRSSTKERELLDSCYRTEYLVESSAGETFLVLWYTSGHYGTADDLGTKCFRVFRLDEQGNASYTEDIGDLCIFLSKSEPFCVPASSFPGLDKNCIFYVDTDECISIIELGCFYLSRADRAEDKNFSTSRTNKVPYLFPPQPMR